MILSFKITTELAKQQGKPDPLLTGQKTCSRREWSDAHAQRWLNAWKKETIHKAYTNLPYVKGAEKLADFRLICRPYREKLSDMPENDLLEEGGLWESKKEFFKLFKNEYVWVVRFQIVSMELLELKLIY